MSMFNASAAVLKKYDLSLYPTGYAPVHNLPLCFWFFPHSFLVYPKRELAHFLPIWNASVCSSCYIEVGLFFPRDLEYK